MSQHLKGNAKEEPKQDDNLQFSWGRRMGNVYYKSFLFDGVEYSLYDYVYLTPPDEEAEPYIGKLVEICETPSDEKLVETLWFLRPSEINHPLQDVKLHKREVFLACRQGEFSSTKVPLESIIAKCNVVCLLDDKRNRLPTEEEQKMADHIFYRTYDDVKGSISDEFPEFIGRTEVVHFFNGNTHGNSDGVSGQEGISRASNGNAYVHHGLKKYASSKAMTDGQVAKEEKGFKEPAALRKMGNSLKAGSVTGNKSKYPTQFHSEKPFGSDLRKKMKLLNSSGPPDDAVPDTQTKGFGNVKVMNAKDSRTEMNNLSTRLVSDAKRNNASEKEAGNRHAVPNRNYEYVEVSRRPPDAAKWLKLQHWNEEGLHSAYKSGTLVLLDNLDPSFTSEEVEDIIWHAFGQRVQAKMIQCTLFGNPYSGRALVLFRSKDAADDAMQRLKYGCLVVDSGRPIVGRRNFIKESNPSGLFFGHLSIDGIRAQKQRRDNRDAVSTSHPSQSNTLEYDLGLQWQLLQSKSERWWTSLSEMHFAELQGLRKQLEDCHRG